LAFWIGPHTYRIGNDAEQEKREVAMASHFQCVVVEASEVPGWPGCWLQLVGANLSAELSAEALDGAIPTVWPRFRGEAEIGELFYLLLVRAQVRLSPGADLVLELSWGRGAEQGDMQILRSKMALLKQLPQMGRPATAPTDFERRVALKWCALFRDTGHTPTQEAVADAVGYPLATFRRLRRKHLGVSWKAYRPDCR
jgi:hypothetical protein